MQQLSVCAKNELAIICSSDIKEIIRSLNNLFQLHREPVARSTHYAINIKITSLPLSASQRDKAFFYLKDVWDMFIDPWIEAFKANTGYSIYSEGRSQGFLYLGSTSDVLAGDEDPDEIRETLVVLLKFKRDWELLLREIKRWLDKAPHPPREGTGE